VGAGAVKCCGVLVWERAGAVEAGVGGRVLLFGGDVWYAELRRKTLRGWGMGESYCTILQLSGAVDAYRLERAYQSSKARYRRLTSEGPLRYYRADLLSDTEKAYRSLRRQISDRESREGVAGVEESGVAVPKALSVVARRAARLGVAGPLKGPTASSLRRGCILPAEPKTLRARTVAGYAKETAASGGGGEVRDRLARAAVEDRYCREVIYRLEGDLIRYESRRELLGLAQELGMEAFRANLLIAQIVEAVRQHKLYVDKGLRGRRVRGRRGGKAGASAGRGKKLGKGVVAGAVVVLAVVVDVVVLYVLGKS